MYEDNTPIRKTRSKQGPLLPGLSFKGRQISVENRNIVRRNLVDTMAGGDDEILNAMTVQELQAEIIRLRQLNDVQNEQLTLLRQQRPENNQNLLQTLIDGFRVLNIEIKPPKFDESENPNLFLEKLNKFFLTKRISEENKLNVLEGVFEGRVRVWFETQRNQFIDFNDFRIKFLNEFYSIPIRVKYKSNWLAKRFEPNRESLHSYFLGQIQQAQYFLPRMEDYEVHYTIISQMPIRVREAMATADFSDFNKISQALNQLDLTFSDKSNGQKKPQSNNNNCQSNTQPHSSASYSNNHSQENKNKIKVSNIRVQGDQILTRVNECSTLINPVIKHSAISNRVRSFKNLPDMSVPPPPYNLQVYRSKNEKAESNHLNGC